jgi:hypothetical protein
MISPGRVVHDPGNRFPKRMTLLTCHLSSRLAKLNWRAVLLAMSYCPLSRLQGTVPAPQSP